MRTFLYPYHPHRKPTDWDKIFIFKKIIAPLKNEQNQFLDK